MLIIQSEHNDYNAEEIELREENYFGRLSEMFIKERVLKKPGDYMISRTHDDTFRFSVMSEAYQIYHLLIKKFGGMYSFENSIYPVTISVATLINKCIRSPMNILSAILKTNVILRHFVGPNVNDKDDYSFHGLFLKPNDMIVKDILISTGKIADELHISNMLQRFMSLDSVVPVESVRIFQSPYIVIYPFMNCGSYVDFAQRMGSRLHFTDKLEVALTIAQALADMHFLGLLHCDIGARNVFVKKVVTVGSKVTKCPSTHSYKYYLGDFRKAHIGKVKKVNPQKPINIRWLAPEVFKTNELTEATDVFALGITFYEIFTGNLPYFSMSPEHIRAELVAGHRIRPDTSDNELPKNVLNLMRRCWHTDVSERPTMDGYIVDGIKHLRLHSSPAKKPIIFRAQKDIQKRSLD
uniref:Protein kinase domain-containing protein n=1 Tax=Setaria digitata TaxID=48799 RepID=A0A915Q1R5_9BILA